MRGIAPIRKQITVRASQARAFEVFTRDMSQWWPPAHSILKSPLKEHIVEPCVGGRWYAVAEDGSSCQTGYVIDWDPPSRLLLAWQLNAEWKFDSQLHTEVEVRFIAESAQTTRVELEHRHLERLGEKAAQVRTAVDSPKGWEAIMNCYKEALT